MIFATCAADPAVTALLGTAPVRLFPFGMAPAGVVKPYAVWQQVGNEPGARRQRPGAGLDLSYAQYV